ncbi:hypothetical protein HanPSC8_Chr11g0459171 [Helianthus annuus]|nr:hypothetical protein HanPSC8_Chr11g0459171 [Helianthus annuus]
MIELVAQDLLIVQEVHSYKQTSTNGPSRTRGSDRTRGPQSHKDLWIAQVRYNWISTVYYVSLHDRTGSCGSHKTVPIAQDHGPHTDHLNYFAIGP